MANIHAAIKQIRKDAKRRSRNQSVLTELRTSWKRLTKCSQAEAAEAKTLAQQLVSKWDRAVSNGSIPKGRADRKKARIAYFLTSLGASR